ncbi:MAG: hypothetical protein B7Y80_19325 [Hyphomicrobium sp. 32-62-53]|nr:MAG: hypothetical protein B7Z29_17880 [Hyphomicrobium sp. 12-62-95]OYX97571.1 MAG: hypothetical protein B7Y80_19325 [Hyphomicrobium sp. 32-62-53]
MNFTWLPSVEPRSWTYELLSTPSSQNEICWPTQPETVSETLRLPLRAVVALYIPNEEMAAKYRSKNAFLKRSFPVREHLGGFWEPDFGRISGALSQTNSVVA